MILGMGMKDKAYHNLRKKYGKDVARIIFNSGIIFILTLLEVLTRFYYIL